MRLFQRFALAGFLSGAALATTACEQEAGTLELGQPQDAGMLDTGAPLDMGSPDLGIPDAGQPDLGPMDAGFADAGMDPDAGPVDMGPIEPAELCDNPEISLNTQFQRDASLPYEEQYFNMCEAFYFNPETSINHWLDEDPTRGIYTFVVPYEMFTVDENGVENPAGHVCRRFREEYSPSLNDGRRVNSDLLMRNCLDDGFGLPYFGLEDVSCDRISESNYWTGEQINNIAANWQSDETPHENYNGERIVRSRPIKTCMASFVNGNLPLKDKKVRIPNGTHQFGKINKRPLTELPPPPPEGEMIIQGQREPLAATNEAFTIAQSIKDYATQFSNRNIASMCEHFGGVYALGNDENGNGCRVLTNGDVGENYEIVTPDPNP